MAARFFASRGRTTIGRFSPRSDAPLRNLTARASPDQRHATSGRAPERDHRFRWRSAVVPACNADFGPVRNSAIYASARASVL
jgi:hypothetical protein